jgi:dTMP kinase
VSTAGIWITIDGPAGTGKTTTAMLLTRRLQAQGHTVHPTVQPSRSEFGRYVRDAITTLDGYPLACVITADRYHQVDTEILPALALGHTVILDRYVPSATLDILRGVPADTVWAMHAALPAPTLAVVLTAEPSTLDERVSTRGPHSRWQIQSGNAEREIEAYSSAAEHLREAGWPIVGIDTTHTGPDAVADVLDRVVRRLTES